MLFLALLCFTAIGIQVAAAETAEPTKIAADPNIVGKYYRETLTLTKAALAKVKELVPGSDGTYQVAGFGWHQGWNDRINDKFNAEYEANMANFIRDIRKDLEVSALPFVIGESMGETMKKLLGRELH